MSKELSEEDRKKYEKLRRQYKLVSGFLENEIKELGEKIQEKKIFLKKIRPQILGTSRLCEKCGIVSMKYLGTFPGTFQPDFEENRVEYASIERYKCLLCSCEEEDFIDIPYA